MWDKPGGHPWAEAAGSCGPTRFPPIGPLWRDNLSLFSPVGTPCPSTLLGGRLWNTDEVNAKKNYTFDSNVGKDQVFELIHEKRKSTRETV